VADYVNVPGFTIDHFKESIKTMSALLIVLHVAVCIALIIVVLLQAGKGAEIGASFGSGASNTVFGATGGKSFMSRMTTAIAIIFMLTSLTLAYFYGQPGSSTIMPASVGTPSEAVQPPLEAPVTPATEGTTAPEKK
jgi:preprotein translocase subunit SecG